MSSDSPRSIGSIGGVMYNHQLLDRLIAPEISNFTAADIPDLSIAFKEQNHWMANHFLNSAFSVRFQGKFRLLAINQIYRTQNCLLEYERGRDLTSYYLRRTHPSHPAIEAYFRALSAWESSLINLAIAVDIFKNANNGEGAFQKGDGSTIEQAYFLANAAKHYGPALANSPTVTDPEGCIPAPDGELGTIPL